MKKRYSGFTLIELLVVIVIIGILATISTATFKSYFGKARDAERESAVQNITLMIKVEGAGDDTAKKYLYDTDPSDFLPSLSELMEANDFRLPKSKNNICYFIGTADGSAGGEVGDKNEFVIATWGEATSTSETGMAGLLLDGTQEGIDALEAATLTVEDFSCHNGTGTMADVVTAFETIIGTKFIRYIDENGAIVQSVL